MQHHSNKGQGRLSRCREGLLNGGCPKAACQARLCPLFSPAWLFSIAELFPRSFCQACFICRSCGKNVISVLLFRYGNLSESKKRQLQRIFEQWNIRWQNNDSFCAERNNENFSKIHLHFQASPFWKDLCREHHFFVLLKGLRFPGAFRAVQNIKRRQFWI